MAKQQQMNVFKCAKILLNVNGSPFTRSSHPSPLASFTKTARLWMRPVKHASLEKEGVKPEVQQQQQLIYQQQQQQPPKYQQQQHPVVVVLVHTKLVFLYEVSLDLSKGSQTEIDMRASLLKKLS